MVTFNTKTTHPPYVYTNMKQTYKHTAMGQNLDIGLVLAASDQYGTETGLALLSANRKPFQDLYSLGGWSSYRKISWSLEAARLDAIMIVSLWIWQESRQRCCCCACRISERLEKYKPESRDFEISRDLAVRD